MSRIEVAAGVVLSGQGNVLLCRRTGELAGLWEFPGGKREARESFAVCLQRELWEELRLRVTVAHEICQMPFTDAKKSLHFSFLLARACEDAGLTLAAHDAARWLSPAALSNYPLCAADAAFLALYPPETWEG